MGAERTSGALGHQLMGISSESPGQKSPRAISNYERSISAILWSTVLRIWSWPYLHEEYRLSVNG